MIERACDLSDPCLSTALSCSSRPVRPPQELHHHEPDFGPGLIERFSVAVASAVFLYLVFFRSGAPIYLFGPAEGGVWIDEGERVQGGEIMYRDFFEFIPPGMVHLNAIVLLVLGPRVVSFSCAAVALGAAGACVLHALAARVVGPRWRVLPPAAFTVLLYAPYSLGNHKMPALVFGLLALLVLVGRPVTPLRSFIAGALLGLSTLFTLDFGVGMAAGTALGFLSERPRRRQGFLLVAGCLAAILPVMGYFAWRAGVSTIVYDCIVFPLTRYRQKNVFTFDLFDHLGPRTLAHYVLAAGGLLSAFAHLGRNRENEPARLIAWVGLGLLAATAHRPLGSLLLAIRCAPLTVTLARCMERLGRTSERPLVWLDRAALAVLATGILWGSLALVIRRQWLEPLTRELHRAGEVWVFSPLEEVSWVESHAVEGERVFLLPSKGGLYFLSRTRNATSLPYLVPGQNPEEHVRRALADLDETRPAVGVWRDSADIPLLLAGLLERYEPQGTLSNGHTVFRRKAVAPD